MDVAAPLDGGGGRSRHRRRDAVLRYLHDDVDDVRLLTEVLVAELVAQKWWAA